jgi:fucose permease
MLLAASLAVFAAAWSAATDVVALVLAGAAAGPIFPSLIATTPARMGARHAANTIGMQIAAAALGQAVGPTLLGAIGRRHGLDALALTLPALAVVVALLVARMSGRPPSEV